MMTQDSSDSSQPLNATSLSIVLLTSAIWGGTPVAVTFAAVSLPPIAIAAVRFSLGAIFMLFWCWIGRTPLRLGPGQLRISSIAGILLFFQIATFNVGISWSNASHATILINTFVFGVIGIEHFVTRTDRLTLRKLQGLLLASASVIVMLTLDENRSNTKSQQDLPSLAGDLLLLFSAFLLSVRIVYVKYALRQIDPGTLMLWHDVIGVILFVVYSFMFEQIEPQRITFAAIIGLGYQGLLVAGLCFALQTQLLRKHSASQLSMFSFSTPLFGIFFAAIFRNDPLSPWLLVAGGCIAAGIYLVSTRRKANVISK
ncbi:MAG: DMT family transporter [Planctomycetaceae bacterium]|nr:DMT family transporter [Planctomycetaceae bacterium]